MSTYSLLLVDDEEEVIQIIIKKMNWEALGFTVVGYAGNGVKALEMVEEYQPDVVMTDIKMPYMDGIELTRQVKERYPETKILVFTGFDEFEYAREAVHMGVEEYILKPINSMELSEIFAQLKKKLDQEISEKRNVETLQQYYMESLPLLQANFYSTLIEGRIAGEELSRYLNDYQITLGGPFYCCLVIHTDLSPVHQNHDRLSRRHNLSYRRQIKQRIRSHLAGIFRLYIDRIGIRRALSLIIRIIVMRIAISFFKYNFAILHCQNNSSHSFTSMGITCFIFQIPVQLIVPVRIHLFFQRGRCCLLLCRCVRSLCCLLCRRRFLRFLHVCASLSTAGTARQRCQHTCRQQQSCHLFTPPVSFQFQYPPSFSLFWKCFLYLFLRTYLLSGYLYAV